MFNNNVLKVTGSISSEPIFSKDKNGTEYCEFVLSTKRLSATSDQLPVLATSKALGMYVPKKGDRITVSGEYRSINYTDVNKKSRLLFRIFAYSAEKNESLGADENCITLSGFVCQKPILRYTPLGKLICDLILAVNGPRRSDYLPIIIWGAYAEEASEFRIGEHVNLSGRIQSREYTKKFKNGFSQVMTAYEVSASMISVAVNEDICES